MSFKINRVTTRTGDNGSTGLVGGARVSKSHPRVEAYGTIDELNVSLGAVVSKIPARLGDLSLFLRSIQQELFDLGAELATPGKPQEMPAAVPGIGNAEVERLSEQGRCYLSGLPELDSFIIPGNSELEAALQTSRVVCRRAERAVVGLAEWLVQAGQGEAIRPEIIKYLNRLSDVLFIVCRWVLAEEGVAHEVWTPKSKRQAGQRPQS